MKKILVAALVLAALPLSVCAQKSERLLRRRPRRLELVVEQRRLRQRDRVGPGPRDGPDERNRQHRFRHRMGRGRLRRLRLRRTAPGDRGALSRQPGYRERRLSDRRCRHSAHQRCRARSSRLPSWPISTTISSPTGRSHPTWGQAQASPSSTRALVQLTRQQRHRIRLSGHYWRRLQAFAERARQSSTAAITARSIPDFNNGFYLARGHGPGLGQHLGLISQQQLARSSRASRTRSAAADTADVPNPQKRAGNAGPSSLSKRATRRAPPAP